jgi:hypothetical protein
MLVDKPNEEQLKSVFKAMRLIQESFEMNGISAEDGMSACINAFMCIAMDCEITTREIEKILKHCIKKLKMKRGE